MAHSAPESGLKGRHDIGSGRSKSAAIEICPSDKVEEAKETDVTGRDRDDGTEGLEPADEEEEANKLESEGRD